MGLIITLANWYNFIFCEGVLTDLDNITCILAACATDIRTLSAMLKVNKHIRQVALNPLYSDQIWKPAFEKVFLLHSSILSPPLFQ